VVGQEFVTGLRVRNLKTGAKTELPVEALFVAIGHKPNTDLVAEQIALDGAGYIKVESGSSRTSVEGIFACATRPTRPTAGDHGGRHRLHGRDRRRALARRPGARLGPVP